MALPRLNLTDQQRQWMAENVRVQDGQVYQRQPDGQWSPLAEGQSIPVPGFAQSFSFGAPRSGGSGGIGVNIPLFGGGGERPGAGATGPGGATFNPNTPAGPIAGSGRIPVSFRPPAQQGNPTPPADTSAPVSAATPGATTPAADTSKTGGKTTAQIIEDLLKQYGPLIGATGKVAGDVLASRAKGREADELANMYYDRTSTDRYNSSLNGVQTDVLQRNYLGENYQRNVGNAIQGGVLQGVEDIGIPRPEGVSSRHITGGMRPSAITGRDEIGAAMQKEAMTELLDPTRTATDPRAATRRLPAIPETPPLSDRPEPGALDTALTWAGYAGTASPLIAELIKQARGSGGTGPTTNNPTPNVDSFGRRRTGAGAWFGG